MKIVNISDVKPSAAKYIEPELVVEAQEIACYAEPELVVVEAQDIAEDGLKPVAVKKTEPELIVEAQEIIGDDLKPFPAEIFYNYQTYIKQKIQQSKKYPLEAKRNGWEGVVPITFLVNKNGDISIVAMLSSSGFDVLDLEAMNTIKRIMPLEPIPAELNIESFKMKVSIVFALD